MVFRKILAALLFIPCMLVGLILMIINLVFVVILGVVSLFSGFLLTIMSLVTVVWIGGMIYMHFDGSFFTEAWFILVAFSGIDIALMLGASLVEILPAGIVKVSQLISGIPSLLWGGEVFD